MNIVVNTTLLNITFMVLFTGVEKTLLLAVSE